MIDKKNNFKIQYTKGDTYALKITLNNVTEAVTTAFFTVKENMDDTTPVIQKTLNAGISLIEDNLYKNQLVYKLQLQVEDSEYLQPDFQYLYDLKITLGNVVKTVISGNFVVNFNVTSVEQIITTLADIEVDNAIETNAETTPATHGIEYEQDPVAMAKIGDITQLNTTAKQNLVSAINEVNTKATASAEEITKLEDGTVSVPEATHATSADNATNADNTTKINNLEIVRDQNGVLKIGNIIIPQKQVLWSGDETVPVFTNFDTLVIQNVDYGSGDTIEILSKLGSNTYITTKIKYNGASEEANSITQCDIIDTIAEIYNCTVTLKDNNSIEFFGPYAFKSESGAISIIDINSFHILKISKIIE